MLGVFLDTYGVSLTNDTLKFPANNVLGFTHEYKEGETKCNGQDAELSVRVWDSYTDTDAGNRYIANMDRIHIDHNGMVFGIYFTPKDAEQVMPPWSSDLPSLGAVDSGQSAPDVEVPGSTVPGSARRHHHARRDDRTGSTTGHVNAGRRPPTPPASTAPPRPRRAELMYAVVLVGGFGTRLRPLTYEIPKPMLPVVHRPMIVRLVERLAAGGVSDVVLALGFKPEPFRDAFPDGRHGDVRIHYAVEPEPLDTAGAIAFAARAGGCRRDVPRGQRRHHHRPRCGSTGRGPPRRPFDGDDPPDSGDRSLDVRCRRDRRRPAWCGASSRSPPPAKPSPISSTPAPTCSSLPCST